MVTVIVVEMDWDPLVALMVMVNVPVGVPLLAEIVSTEVPVPPDTSVTEVKLRVAVGLCLAMGETLVERLIVPANPPTLVRVIIELP